MAWRVPPRGGCTQRQRSWALRLHNLSWRWRTDRQMGQLTLGAGGVGERSVQSSRSRVAHLSPGKLLQWVSQTRELNPRGGSVRKCVRGTGRGVTQQLLSLSNSFPLGAPSQLTSTQGPSVPAWPTLPSPTAGFSHPFLGASLLEAIPLLWISSWLLYLWDFSERTALACGYFTYHLSHNLVKVHSLWKISTPHTLHPFHFLPNKRLSSFKLIILLRYQYATETLLVR